MNERRGYPSSVSRVIRFFLFLFHHRGTYHTNSGSNEVEPAPYIGKSLIVSLSAYNHNSAPVKVNLCAETVTIIGECGVMPPASSSPSTKDDVSRRLP